jgi:hypothetical protein
LLPKKKDVKVIKQSLQEMCDFLTYLAWQQIRMSLYHSVYDILF